MKILIGASELGLVFGIMAMGVFITYRILDFADLTCDGSITLGASVAAVVIGKGLSPWSASILALFAGALAGLTTGILHTKLKIAPLLSGILTMTALYSVNLRIMGRANLPLLGEATVADSLSAIGVVFRYRWVSFGLLLAALIIGVLTWFFKTELGLALRATGDNEVMAKSQGVNVDKMKILGLSLGNALVALSGGMVAQLQGFADMGMGVGTVVCGLAAVIIGETLLGSRTMFRALLGVISGSMVYRTVISLALRMGFKTTDLKFITAVLVVLALSLPKFKVGKKPLSGRCENAAIEEGNQDFQ